jgi:hypothetical protein
MSNAQMLAHPLPRWMALHGPTPHPARLHETARIERLLVRVGVNGCLTLTPPGSPKLRAGVSEILSGAARRFCTIHQHRPRQQAAASRDSA